MNKGITEEIARLLNAAPKPMTGAQVVAAMGQRASEKTIRTLLTQKCKPSARRSAQWRKMAHDLYWANQ